MGNSSSKTLDTVRLSFSAKRLPLQAEKAQHRNIVMELNLDGNHVMWTNYTVLYMGSCRWVATQKLREDDSHAVEVRFYIRIEPFDDHRMMFLNPSPSPASLGADSESLPGTGSFASRRIPWHHGADIAVAIVRASDANDRRYRCLCHSTNTRANGTHQIVSPEIAIRRDLHPQILLQRHINRSHRRLARMTGTVDVSPKICLERLAAREAQIATRSLHVGHAGANHGSPSGPNAASTAVANGTLTPANTPTTPNSIGLADQGADTSYVATIDMGTPPRSFHVLVDSGSADLWVGAEDCVSTSGTNCGVGKPRLSRLPIFIFVSEYNTVFSNPIWAWGVSGIVVKDNVAIAGLQLGNHPFGVATQETDNFASSTSSPFDGIMGLARSTISQQRVPTVVEALATNGLIQHAITSYKLSRLADQKNDGEITFGGLDTSKFDQNTLITIPISTHWASGRLSWTRSR
ncbi:aspartic peptidase domain-containing protein [Lactifluus volemus]|nr:aspartic peptidase domain-containing protein [Lactifluus volemus]